MRKIMISSALPLLPSPPHWRVQGTPAASGTPQSPRSETFLVSCPNLAPVVATSPTPSRVAPGQTVAVIPGHLPRAAADFYMTCSPTVLPDGPTFHDIPILIASTSGTSH